MDVKIRFKNRPKFKFCAAAMLIHVTKSFQKN